MTDGLEEAPVSSESNVHRTDMGPIISMTPSLPLTTTQTLR